MRLVPVDDEAEPDASWADVPYDESAAIRGGLGIDETGEGTVDRGGDDGCGGGIPVLGSAVHAVCRGVDWAANETRRAFVAGFGILRGASRAGRVLADRFGPQFDRLLDDLQHAGAELRDRLLDTPLGRALSDVVEVGERFLEWTRRECSGDAPPADGTGGSGHLVMAVAGIDSSIGRTGERSFGLDVDTLGYHGDEVHWYSYADDGGAYTADDTHGDLRLAAKRLADQLHALEADEPAREVDLIAHSQGGVVVQRFLEFEYDAVRPRASLRSGRS